MRQPHEHIRMRKKYQSLRQAPLAHSATDGLTEFSYNLRLGPRESLVEPVALFSGTRAGDDHAHECGYFLGNSLLTRDAIQYCAYALRYHRIMRDHAVLYRHD